MPISPQSDCGEAGKRRMEIDGGGGGGDGGGDGGGEVKRRRKEEVNGGDAEMKRVAELVLVLSAMGKMRGGSDPTVVETEMMAEARKKVVALCEEFSPKDIVPREVFCGVMEDLGLSRLKDQRLGFRPPKLSISDKIALTKRRMEESNAFAAQSAQYSAPRLQTGSGAASENNGTQPPVRVFPADKASQVSVSPGNFQPPTTVVHTPPAVQTPPVNVSTPSSAFSTVSRSAGKDSTSAIPTRSDRVHIRPDGRLNGPTAVPQIPVSSPADRHTVRITPVHMQPQPSSRINIGTSKKAPDQFPARVTSGIQMPVQPVGVQAPRPVVSQAAPGTLPTMHHTVQGLQNAHPPAVSHHVEISQVVHRLLNPKVSQRPTWTPPSREYMTKAHPCQFCKLVSNEVETVVICDACEKAFHLGCLQSHNVKGIPKLEWHCPRCMTMNHGKPFPPKYGRVTRNMNAPKGTSNASVSHFQSDKKLESVNEKMSQPSATTNGNVNVKTQSQAVNIAEPSFGSNLPHGIDPGRTVKSVGIKKEIEPNMGSGPKDRMTAAVDASLLTSAGSSSSSIKKLPYQAVKPDILHPEHGFIPQSESCTPVITQANSASENLPVSSTQNNVDRKVSNCDKIPPVQHGDSNGVVGCNQNYHEERCQKDGAKQNLVVTDKVHDQAREVVGTLESELNNVDWIGEIDKVVDGKKFFRSCRINGVVYHVENYALFRSSIGKLTPFRLQGMWEDSQTSSNWLLVHKCYFPDDLPGEVGRPGAPQINEVYESTHDSSVMAGSVQGPCQVLPFRKFGEEAGISEPTSQGNERTGPVFVRNWFYDDSKRAFCPSAS
ncbi:uncharacterized protein LOC141646814 [Silene latifolia]|uniref:uncharacterized protein LOC141646814 n=1 Tax=Silene latifolia TaxID=37657 RepID=UPI003D78579B